MRAPSGFSRGFGETELTRQDLTASSSPSIEEALRRIRGEFLEMPGLRLTSAQARRLWGLERTLCETLLGLLIETGFLRRTRDGSYVRAQSGPQIDK